VLVEIVFASTARRRATSPGSSLHQLTETLSRVYNPTVSGLPSVAVCFSGGKASGAPGEREGREFGVQETGLGLGTEQVADQQVVPPAPVLGTAGLRRLRPPDVVSFREGIAGLGGAAEPTAAGSTAAGSD